MHDFPLSLFLPTWAFFLRLRRWTQIIVHSVQSLTSFSPVRRQADAEASPFASDATACPPVPARSAFRLPVSRASRSARESRRRMLRKRGNRDRGALGEPLGTARGIQMFHVKHLFSNTRSHCAKHSCVSRRLGARRVWSRITPSARARRLCASVVQWERERGFVRARVRRDALRLRHGRTTARVGRLRGRRVACVGRSCEQDALRCGCGEPAFTLPGTLGARASDRPLRHSPARRARTACRHRAPCCRR